MTVLQGLRRLRARLGGHPVFDRGTDAVLRRLGREARQALESVSTDQRRRVLFFPSYIHSKYVALHDATMALALQIRGADVVPVLSGMFYREEDVIYGGAYNARRFDNQYLYASNENRIFASLLNTDPISLNAVANLDVERQASEVTESVQFHPERPFVHDGLPVGYMAAQLVANMNNVPAMNESAEHIRQWRHHLYNILRLMAACRAILDIVQPTVIVSNVPFYYKWRVPFELARSRNIPFYSSMVAERKNSFAWNRDTSVFFDASACWESFRDSGLYAKNERLAVEGIEERRHGLTSHIRFLPAPSTRSPEADRIRAAIAGRPAVLLPANVLVDAAVLIPTRAFASCMEMIADVVDYFRRHPEYVCLLKAHPAEKLWASTGTNVDLMHLRDALADRGIALPQNVLFIDFDTNVSSFDLYELVRGLIAYTSSTAMEIGWFGKRAITAQEAHYTCAGFALSPASREQFFHELDALLSKPGGDLPDQEVQRLARIYYLLYSRVTQTDMGLLQGNDLGTTPARLRYDSLDALQPGANAALDYICDAILTGKPIFGPGRWPPIT